MIFKPVLIDFCIIVINPDFNFSIFEIIIHQDTSKLNCYSFIFAQGHSENH